MENIKSGSSTIIFNNNISKMDKMYLSHWLRVLIFLLTFQNKAIVGFLLCVLILMI